MRDQDKKLVDNIVDSWKSGETSTELAAKQLTRIAEVTSDEDLRSKATASLETVKANS